jgi:hypothetical protein
MNRKWVSATQLNEGLFNNKNKVEKIVKDYASGGWRRVLSGLANVPINTSYISAIVGSATALGAGMAAFMSIGWIYVLLAIAGTFGLLIKSLLLGVDNILRRDPRMKNLFVLSKKDTEAMGLIESLKKELDAEKPSRETVKDLKRKLIDRFKILEKQQRDEMKI